MAAPQGCARHGVEPGVVQRAESGAASAAGTQRGVGAEMAVGGEETVEQRTQDVTFQSGPAAGHHIFGA